MIESCTDNKNNIVKIQDALKDLDLGFKDDDEIEGEEVLSRKRSLHQESPFESRKSGLVSELPDQVLY